MARRHREARTALDAAEAEARSNGWTLVFVISDAEGTPIYLRRMDGAPKRNYDVAMNKISTSITAGMHTGDYVAAVRAGTIQAIEGALMFAGNFRPGGCAPERSRLRAACGVTPRVRQT